MSIWSTIKEMFFGSTRIQDQLAEIVEKNEEVIKEEVSEIIEKVKKSRKKKAD